MVDMSEAQNFLQYGTWGALAYIVVKWVLPHLKASASRSGVEGTIYDNAKDSINYAYEQLERQRERYDKLRKDYECVAKELRAINILLIKEQAKSAEIEDRLNKILDDRNG